MQEWSKRLRDVAVLNQLFDTLHQNLFSDLIVSCCGFQRAPELNCSGVWDANAKHE